MDILKHSKQFLASLNNLNWALTADERTIDDLFDCALKLEQVFLEEHINGSTEISFQSHSSFNFNKPVNILLESIIKNQILNEHLTLYAIEKYNLVYSKDNFSVLLEKILSEVELRKHLCMLIEGLPDADSNFLNLNNFLQGLIDSYDLNSKILHALKFQTSILLNAIKCAEFITGWCLIDEMILCLESQTDLRLWYMIFKHENLDVVLDLCDMYNNFLIASFKFFDRYADEIESNYDEELNVQYSHVNLDFEDFVKVFQLFLNKQNIKKKSYDYLDGKTIKDKNFCFWVDLKLCL